MEYEIVDRAIDANGFQSTAASAGYINPEIWNKDVLRFKESQLVITKLGRVYKDLDAMPGDTLNITVDGDAAEASALTESSDADISALTMTQVQFTPTEYGVAYQVSDKERRRTFMDLMGNITQKIGYGLALKMEKLVITALTDGTGNSVVANGVTASDIASSDTLDESDILAARAEIKKDKFVPTDLVVSVGQEKALLGNSLFNNADKYGARDAVLGGYIGEAFGVRIHWSDLITPTSTRSKALMLGKSKSGEECFGIAVISEPSIEMERHALGRYTDVIGVEDYQVKVLHANAICTIETYDAY
jgi:N4-gp56 family major capsid protein